MSTLKVNAVTDTTGLLPPVFPAGSAQLNPLANREDKIINGDFGIWQRGTTQSTVIYGSADRWVNEFVGGASTMSQQSFAVGETLGANSPRFFLRQSVSGQTLSTQYAIVDQRIESVRSYAGQTITVLGWAKRSSGSGNMAVAGYQFFGTGGATPSDPVAAISPGTVTLGSSWAPFAVVMNVPSITGKTLGTNNNDWLGVFIWTSAGSNNNASTNSLGLQTIGVDLWGIHIRQGTWTAAATADYRPRDPGTELALCERYYEVTNGNLVLFSGSVGTGLTYYAAQSFRTTKRANPAITITANSTIGFNNSAGSTSLGPGGFFEFRNAIATAANGVWSSFWSADAEL